MPTLISASIVVVHPSLSILISTSLLILVVKSSTTIAEGDFITEINFFYCLCKGVICSVKWLIEIFKMIRKYVTQSAKMSMNFSTLLKVSSQSWQLSSRRQNPFSSSCPTYTFYFNL